MRRKLFTEQVSCRSKLFTAPPMVDRKKLFSVVDVELTLIKCKDCGYSMETAVVTTDVSCPKCGGLRFDHVAGPGPEVIEETVDRQSLFSDIPAYEMDPVDEFECSLRTYSGKSLSNEEIEKNFSNISGDDLVDLGFARGTEGGFEINEGALMVSKLFSKLTISVTKTLELDPVDRPKSDIIEELSDRGMSPKGIMILSKAHGIPTQAQFSEWIDDSGIINDITVEFGGKQLPIDEFNSIVEERYEDAPGNIVDILEAKGVLKINDNQVEILK